MVIQRKMNIFILSKPLNEVSITVGNVRKLL